MIIANTAVKPVANALAVVSVLSTAPFGIPLDDIGWGALFFSAGIIGRAIVEILSCVERNDALDRKLFVKWGIWVVFGMLGSVFVSCLWIAIAMGMGWAIGPMTVVVLLVLGFGGPKAIMRFTELVNSLVTSKFSIVGGDSNAGPPAPPPGGKNGP